MTKIKESIQIDEYNALMNHVKYSSTMRSNTKQNMSRLFTLLYYTGMRINEVPTLTIHEVLTGLSTGKLIIKAHKQKKERSIPLTPSAVSALTPLFIDAEPTHRVIQAKANPFNSISPIAFINRVNKTIQSVLGDRYTSHSFRQGLITELGVRGVNPAIIKQFIGHENIATTLRYIKPSDDDILNALVR